jgi:hypothetical protein
VFRQRYLIILSREHPAARERNRKHLKDRHLVEVARKGLLAGLVPEHRAARVSADGTAEKGPSKQSPFRHAPRTLFGADLVEAEQHECPDVDEREGGEAVGDGEEGSDVHSIIP